MLRDKRRTSAYRPAKLGSYRQALPLLMEAQLCCAMSGGNRSGACNSAAGRGDEISLPGFVFVVPVVIQPLFPGKTSAPRL
jgi:hypothetical protein